MQPLVGLLRLPLAAGANGQAARLVRPGPVDLRLFPNATIPPVLPEREIETLDDVVAGLPLTDNQRADVLRIAGDTNAGPARLGAFRAALADRPELIREVSSRAARWARRHPPARRGGQMLPLVKSGVIAVGPHGGKIVGYAHGDHKRPIYEGANPGLTHAHVYPPGGVKTPVDVPVNDVNGPYAWTAHEAINGGKPTVVHLPTGRTIKAVEHPRPKATASAAVKELAAKHGHLGLDAAPGGFAAKPDYATIRATVEKWEMTGPPPKGVPGPSQSSSKPAPTPAAVTPPASKPEAPKPSQSSSQVGQIDAGAAKALVEHVAATTGLTHDQIRTALTAPDASSKSPQVAKHRAAIESAILAGGKERKDALLELFAGGHHDQAEVHARVTAIGHGQVGLAVKEYGQTPVYDLQIVGSVTVSPSKVGGQAFCTWTRELTMGPGPEGKHITGDFRHELGHAVRMGWGDESPMSKAVFAHYADVRAKMKATPAKVAQTYDWYEEHYGVISDRGLDNREEDAAEHYRGYHREALRHRFKGGTALHVYRARHPEMARLWDARYTAALLASAAKKGLW